jgi:murein DD-endopeptidase MepM/ murein hydrolase activator NlpD
VTLRIAALSLLCLAAAPSPIPPAPIPPAPTPALPGAAELRLPIAGACISSPFGPRRAAGPHAALFHNGIDLPAPAGTWVAAAASGQVVAVRRLGSSGLEIDIAHGTAGQGFLTRYAHLGSIAPAIAGGAGRVAVGERIGRIGRTGVTYGTHLHFELHLDGHPVDPAPYFTANLCGMLR